MNKKITTFTIIGFVSVLTFTGIAPGFANASSLSERAENIHLSKVDDSFKQRKLSELEKIIKKENLSEDELVAYGDYVKAETSSEITVLWKGAVIKKVVKYMVDHSDIIPSATLRKVVDKYGSKIIKGIDTAETYTWYGIAKALSKVGIPDKYADAIADFIVKFLL